MQRYLGRFEASAYTLLRVVLAFLYWSHGPKWLFGWFGGRPGGMTFEDLPTRFVVAGVLSAAGLWHWRGERGTGYLAVALAGSLACLLLQSRRMKRTRQMASAVSEVPSPSA